jgi:hypothetical protein
MNASFQKVRGESSQPIKNIVLRMNEFIGQWSIVDGPQSTVHGVKSEQLGVGRK